MLVELPQVASQQSRWTEPLCEAVAGACYAVLCIFVDVMVRIVRIKALLEHVARWVGDCAIQILMIRAVANVVS